MGTQARKYKINNDNTKYDINSLPDYVYANPTKFITGDNKNPSGGYDNENTEPHVVYDIAVKMKVELEKYGHKVYLTRSHRDTISLSEEENFTKYSSGSVTKAAAITFRAKMASSLKADYFISIHCDAADNFAKGAHTIYTDDTSKQLAINLVSSYDITTISSKSPDKRTDLGVLKSSNSSKKKVLIEIGFLTNPLDAKNIINNKDKIATQLVKGLIKDINENKNHLLSSDFFAII